MKVTVIGAGSFGTAMAAIAARCDHEVLLWAHDPRVAQAIQETHTNPFYLSRIPLAPAVRATSDLAEAAAFSDTVFMIVPSHHYRGVLKQLKESLEAPIRVISATKGIENESLQRISQVSAEVLGGAMSAFAVLSGPTFALETARGDPTTAVIASSNQEFALEVQRMLSCGSFRLYRSDDVAGVELSGSLKNIIAIAAGVVEGLGLGSNTNAALVTRGLHEIRRLGLSQGGKHETFAGLAGMGDLVLTCTGALSRNRSVGIGLGTGKTLEEVLGENRFVAEGVRTCLSARDLAERHAIEMPITSEMYRVLYENELPRDAIHRLMSRSLKAEDAR